MTGSDKKVQTVWQELVQRRVVRVAILYGAGAWLLIQVADVLLDAFEADAALKYLIAAALAGFPIALVLTWMFDITPQGIVRSPPLEPTEESRRSIAVLPFTNLSDDSGNEYFSDGLAEEIRDQLARVPDMRVAARTSSFAFKGKHVDAREIGRQLNVGLLVEGGVRKHLDTLRISAQLVDAHRGYQIWSETYERRLEDVFALQTEISRSILDAVHVRVLDTGAAKGRTADFEAYNLYLHGRYHFHKRTESSLNRAVEYFRRAIAHDPQYAQAYSGLADTMSLLSTGFYGNLSPEESIAEALHAAERALEIAPQSAEAHASIGLIRRMQRSLDAAEKSLQRAIELDRSYALAYVWLGLVLQGQGRFREAAECNHEALRLDPLSPIANANAGFDAVRFGRDKEAEEHFRNVIELDPTFAVAYSGMARVFVQRGAIDEAFQWLNKAIERAPTRWYYLARKGYFHLQLGQIELAGEWLQAARRNSPDNRHLRDVYLGLAIAADDRERLAEISEGDALFGEEQRALAAMMLGDEAQALALYRRHCPDHLTLLCDLIGGEWLWRIPHSIYRGALGLRQGEADAEADIERLLELLDGIWRDGIANGETRYWAAAALATLGRAKEAIARLEEAVELGWRNVWWARRDPCLEALRKEPRCEAVLADAERRVAEARGRTSARD